MSSLLPRRRWRKRRQSPRRQARARTGTASRRGSLPGASTKPRRSDCSPCRSVRPRQLTPPCTVHGRIVYNAAGRYEAALEAAQRSCDIHPFGVLSWSLVELVEAAARCGQHERAGVALEQLVDRTRLASTDWSLGIEARSAALLEDDPAVAETRHRERNRPTRSRAHSSGPRSRPSRVRRVAETGEPPARCA